MFFVGPLEPGLVKVVNLKNVYNEKGGRREQAQNEFVFLVEFLEAERREELVAYVKRALEIGRHLVELEYVDEQKNHH